MSIKGFKFGENIEKYDYNSLDNLPAGYDYDENGNIIFNSKLYVKNYINKTTEVLPETTATFTSDGGYDYVWYSGCSLSFYDVYDIIIDGVIYENVPCKYNSSVGWTYVGNAAIYGFDDDTGEDYLFFVNSVGELVARIGKKGASGTHTFSIRRVDKRGIFLEELKALPCEINENDNVVFEGAVYVKKTEYLTTEIVPLTTYEFKNSYDYVRMNNSLFLSSDYLYKVIFDGVSYDNLTCFYSYDVGYMGIGNPALYGTGAEDNGLDFYFWQADSDILFRPSSVGTHTFSLERIDKNETTIEELDTKKDLPYTVNENGEAIFNDVVYAIKIASKRIELIPKTIFSFTSSNYDYCRYGAIEPISLDKKYEITVDGVIYKNVVPKYYEDWGVTYLGNGALYNIGESTGENYLFWGYDNDVCVRIGDGVAGSHTFSLVTYSDTELEKRPVELCSLEEFPFTFDEEKSVVFEKDIQVTTPVAVKNKLLKNEVFTDRLQIDYVSYDNIELDPNKTYDVICNDIEYKGLKCKIRGNSCFLGNPSIHIGGSAGEQPTEEPFCIIFDFNSKKLLANAPWGTYTITLIERYTEEVEYKVGEEIDELKNIKQQIGQDRIILTDTETNEDYIIQIKNGNIIATKIESES